MVGACQTFYSSSILLLFLLIVERCLLAHGLTRALIVAGPLRWEKVDISGAPPPPARLDFAMCSVQLPVSRQLPPSAPCAAPPRNERACDVASDIMDDGGCGDGKEEVPQWVRSADTQELVDDRHGDDGGKDREQTRERENADSAAGPCQTVTIINPEDSALKFSAFSSTPTLWKPESAPLNIDTAPCEGVEFDLVPALFVFGGVDSSGHIHGDSFIFVPS